MAAPRIEPEPPAIVEPLLAPRVLTIAHPADAYNEPFMAGAAEPLAEAVRAALRETAGPRAEVAADPRLDLACDDIAAVVADDDTPSPALVEFALHGHGIAQPAERVLVVRAAPAEQVTATIRAQIGDAVAGRVRVGVGVAGGGSVVAILLTDTGVELAATPRALAAHHGVELSATLDPRLDSPQVTVTYSDGTSERPSVTLDDGGRRFRAPFTCGEHTGRQWIEIDARGEAGMLPRASFPILCGGDWPASFAIEPSANVARLSGADALERRLSSIINRERARAGLPLLHSDLRVARSARAYSTAARDARAADRAVTAETPTQRLQAAGIAPVAILENHLEVDSLARAAEELMNDAKFRADLEAPSTTHAGVGVAYDGTRHRLFVTITYVEFPPRIDAPKLARCVFDAIERVEGSHMDLALSRAAQRFADGLARGVDRDELWPVIRRDLELANRGRFEKIDTAVVTLADVRRVDPRDLVHHRLVDALGVGVAQSAREGPQGGVTWVVAFLGQQLFRRRFRLGEDPEPETLRACLAAADGA